MKEFKGTPGPWKVYGANRNKPGVDSEYKTVVLWGDIEDAAGIINSGEEQQANANLIAAAPELLEVLQEFVELAKRPFSQRDHLDYNNYKEAVRVISKALGS